MAAKLYKVGDVIDGNLKLTEKIGEGVFLSKNVDMPELKYVVKIFDKLKMNQADIADYKREICIMKKLSGHPNIVQYINNFETANYHYLIMEYYETDLFDVIVEIDGLETSLVKRIFSDITQGLNYAHQNGIYHRDIKPENILITGGQVKLADFGLSTADKYTDNFGVGSTRYMAPECFGHIEIDYDSGIDFEADCYNVPAADVWSLGIVLLNLISGRCPWDKASVSDLIFQQYVTTDPDILREKLNMSEKLDDFLREKVFNMVPEKRCNLNEFNAFVSSQKCFRKDDFSTSVSDFKIVGIDSEPSVYYSNTTFDQ